MTAAEPVGRRTRRRPRRATRPAADPSTVVLPPAPASLETPAAAPAEPTPQETALVPEPDLVPVREPREGVPEVITDRAALRTYAEALRSGTGPVAVDAERASSFRYGQRAYLVQLRREGAGTALIDPVALDGDLSEIGEALRGVEWVLHAADQDLPCLAEAGMRPDALFDTELAARLLGRERVGLGAVVAEELGLGLTKEHSAADWSTRPLPRDWLVYAALDVELLVAVRDHLAADLDRQGKTEWARQEFEHVRTAAPKPALADPWRKLPRLTSSVRNTRGMAVARELWTTRDEIARAKDLAPTRLLPNAAIVAAARSIPRSAKRLGSMPEFSRKHGAAHVADWFAAVERAMALPEKQLPPRRPARDPHALPTSRSWRDVRPAARDCLDVVRGVVRPMAQELSVPQENLLQPAAQKALAWAASEGRAFDVQEVVAVLQEQDARPWQIRLLAAPLAEALSQR